MNRLKSVALLATLTALLLWAGQAFGGGSGLLIALVVAGLMNVGAYWWSDTLLLRMYSAQEVTASEAPELWSMVRNLATRANLPMPRVYIMPEATPNAFATGRNPHNAAVAATAGLMRMLERDELEGVLAHELAHVRHRDTLVMTVTASLAGALSMLANMAMFGALFGGGDGDDEEGGHPFAGLLGVMVAPFAATLIQLAISRSREFLADQLGAELTRNPLALARALRKIEGWSQAVPMTAGSPAAATISASQPMPSWGMIGLHVLALTAIGNLGKMFPLVCYRQEAHWKERLALCIGLWPRGEVGAGVLILSLSYGIGGPLVTVAMLCLALNLILTGGFILIVKRLVGQDAACAVERNAPPQSAVSRPSEG